MYVNYFVRIVEEDVTNLIIRPDYIRPNYQIYYILVNYSNAHAIEILGIFCV